MGKKKLMVEINGVVKDVVYPAMISYQDGRYIYWENGYGHSTNSNVKIIEVEIKNI